MMSPEDVELYELFCRLMERQSDPLTHKHVIYYPQLFIDMAKEILSLRAQVERLERDSARYREQVEWNIRLSDQLKYVKRQLDERGIKLDVSWR